MKNCLNKPPHCEVEDHILHVVNRKFATNESVARLAKEIRTTNDNINIKATEAATTAAAVVLKQIQPDLKSLDGRIDDIKTFGIQLSTADNNGKPLVEEPNQKTIYLTKNDGMGDNKWNEWLAVPNVDGSWEWEMIGYKDIDLDWVKDDFEDVNKQIHQIRCRMSKMSKEVADAIIDKAIKPIKEIEKKVKDGPDVISPVDVSNLWGTD